MKGLIEKNIPKLSVENCFTRYELYKVFGLYKTLCKITALKHVHDAVQGVDYDAFRTGVADLAVENDELV